MLGLETNTWAGRNALPEKSPVWHPASRAIRSPAAMSHEWRFSSKYASNLPQATKHMSIDAAPKRRISRT